MHYLFALQCLSAAKSYFDEQVEVWRVHKLLSADVWNKVFFVFQNYIGRQSAQMSKITK